MIISLKALKKVLRDLATEKVQTDPALDYESSASLNIIADHIWSTIHETASADEVICPHCHEGTMRPCVVANGADQLLAIGCDECKYTETAE